MNTKQVVMLCERCRLSLGKTAWRAEAALSQKLPWGQGGGPGASTGSGRCGAGGGRGPRRLESPVPTPLGGHGGTAGKLWQKHGDSGLAHLGSFEKGDPGGLDPRPQSLI